MAGCKGSSGFAADENQTTVILTMEKTMVIELLPVIGYGIRHIGHVERIRVMVAEPPHLVVMKSGVTRCLSISKLVAEALIAYGMVYSHDEPM